MNYLRRLTASQRTHAANVHLARYLAFVAGAANSGGFLAVHQYTSHMSGIVSTMADNLALGNVSIVLTGLAAFLAFLSGAFCTSLTIRWARRKRLGSEYALPLILEAGLLVAFGIIGREFQGETAVGTIMLLCFTMGLQNAMITKLSGSVIRTTHLTGMVTDIGIELGRLVLSIPVNNLDERPHEGKKILLLSSLISVFLVGGITGALGFKRLGFLFTIPLSAVLVTLAGLPVWDDLRHPCILNRS